MIREEMLDQFRARFFLAEEVGGLKEWVPPPVGAEGGDTFIAGNRRRWRLFR